jgi:hypothetical protein
MGGVGYAEPQNQLLGRTGTRFSTRPPQALIRMRMYPARVVASICYAADRATRRDLAEGSVVSERDYMSTLSTRIRDAWLPAGKAYAYSKTLPGDVEQALGCDTLIMIHDNDGAKLCLIEAKWPRVATKPGHRWDKVQKIKGTAKPVSHFSDQLSRQRQVLPDAFVAEMFLLESPPGTKSNLLDDFGATLVSHKHAREFDAIYRQRHLPWSNQDFWELIAFSRKRTLNLQGLMYGLASCQIGQPLPIVNGAVAVSVDGAASPLSIPTSIDQLSQMGPEICERVGLSTLLVLQTRWLG